jgi:hypothetical protein
MDVEADASLLSGLGHHPGDHVGTHWPATLRHEQVGAVCGVAQLAQAGDLVAVKRVGAILAPFDAHYVKGFCPWIVQVELRPSGRPCFLTAQAVTTANRRAHTMRKHAAYLATHWVLLKAVQSRSRRLFHR